MGIFDGVKVIDFTHAYAGPFATLNLADFGADVIKIERRDTGDVSRGWGPFKNDYSGYYSSFNRGKRSITLDFRSEEGQKVIFDLVKDADIVCSNFKAGTLDKYGIGYDKMKEIKPDIIYAAISGFGETGVLSSFAAYDNVVQAISGLMDVTGFQSGDPTKIGPAIGDSFTGLLLFMGIATAYYHKLKTGKGQKIDVTMLGSLLMMLDNPIMASSVKEEKVTRIGNMNPHYSPCDIFKVKDGYVTIAVKNQKMWDSFCSIVSDNEILSDKRFETNEERLKNSMVLKEIIDNLLQDKTKEEIEEKLTGAGIPCAPVMNIKEAFDNEQLIERDMIVELADPGTGSIKVVGNPIKLSRDLPVISKPSPLLGHHTDEILKEIGYEKGKISELKEQNII
ncbi:CoA:oxalate CoA-transferase [Dethiosulfatibacter aminovorans DSM 17477]|uniref:CoA:oxalate CoA-transferase n=1 Tax=Dethiosulfatibacter aminovorans DSM 17477 TaxID=1121476 RepID=A0A1M6ANE3_9FIRM|nr:CoA transferase [Dethiosulfatibacter aminovorans]SHI37713.1 CoA:oxalate CoA-transferase [Dethiosulfatibacter aminovorans DSM 17477]